MAQELQVAGSISFSKSGAALSRTFPNTYFDVSGTAGIANVISVGTSDESLALGDISTIGWVYLKNLDATNYISVGSDGTLYPIKMKLASFSSAAGMPLRSTRRPTRARATWNIF